MSTTTPTDRKRADPVRATGLDPTDPRTDCALTEQMSVRACGQFAYEVQAASGNTYFVHLGAEACTCPDWQQRHPECGCKHLRRVRLSHLERPEAKTFARDDRPVVQRRRAVEQLSPFPAVHVDQRTVNGEVASFRRLFGKR